MVLELLLFLVKITPFMWMITAGIVGNMRVIHLRKALQNDDISQSNVIDYHIGTTVLIIFWWFSLPYYLMKLIVMFFENIEKQKQVTHDKITEIVSIADINQIKKDNLYLKEEINRLRRIVDNTAPRLGETKIAIDLSN